MAQNIAFSQNIPLFKYLKILKLYPPQGHWCKTCVLNFLSVLEIVFVFHWNSCLQQSLMSKLMEQYTEDHLVSGFYCTANCSEILVCLYTEYFKEFFHRTSEKVDESSSKKNCDLCYVYSQLRTAAF
jgi:hypothetical protein